MEGIQHLDLIIFLPLDEEIYTEENVKLRRAMDYRLRLIFSRDEFDMVSSKEVAIVEANGSIKQRLQVLEDAISSCQAGLKK